MKHRQALLFQSQDDTPGGLASADVQRFPGASRADVEYSNHGVARWTGDLVLLVTGAAQIWEKIDHVSLPTLHRMDGPDNDLRLFNQRTLA
jgi:hypothetical protein